LLLNCKLELVVRFVVEFKTEEPFGAQERILIAGKSLETGLGLRELTMMPEISTLVRLAGRRPGGLPSETNQS
jgi:hypothetical protein